MGSRDHYVSRFFLSQFADPASIHEKEPWLWVAHLTATEAKRRAPKNLGWSRDLFAGPGGLADRTAALEAYIAEQIEGPAARALRAFCEIPIGQVKEIPAELSRYLSWLAARSITMKKLYESWIAELEPLETTRLVEDPPPALLATMPAPERVHVMEHPEFSIRRDVSDDEIENLRCAGWRWRLSNDDFLEMVHTQAYYFQVRFFPRLSWKVLHAPEERWFVTCDRPLVWGVDGAWEVPPAALRHERAELVVPISRSRALYAAHPSYGPLAPVSPAEINRVMAIAAHQWVAGPERSVVEQSLRDRAV